MTEHADPVLAAIAEWNRACGVTEAAIETYRIAIEAGDFTEAEAYFSSCNRALFAARDAALKTLPTTVDGAITMMRFLAGQVDDLAEDPDHRPTLISAIRAAADAIEMKAPVDAPQPETLTADEREALLDAYNCWLEMERRWLAHERSGGNDDLFETHMNTVIFATHGAAAYQGHAGAPASARAELVLRAIGCSWRRGEAVK
jgi:hypothetical protein